MVHIALRFDTMIGIWDAAGVLVDVNDDSFPDDPGDYSFPNLGTLNSRLSLNLAPGTYTVGVSRYFSSFEQLGVNVGEPIPIDGTYVLNISTNTVPEPASIAIWSLGGLAGFFVSRRKRTRTV